MTDPLEIPAFLDRRDEPKKPAADIPKRQWIMPDSKRLARQKRKREKETQALKRAERKDMALGHAQDDVIDQAANLQRTTQ